MQQFQSIIDSAVADGAAPFLVAGLAGPEGTRWLGQAGDVSGDTPQAIFSMTKAVAALAAIMLVERGQLDLDTPVGDLVPEFDALKRLVGFDDETPILMPPTARATVRQLMTHESGLEYEHWNKGIARWRKATGAPSIARGTREGLMYPLTFEPGERFGYGIGIDWLGLVIEAASGRSITAFCQEEIFGPLGLTATTFDAPEGTAPMFARAEDGFKPSPLAPPPSPEFYGMGQCLYSTASDYLRLLRLFLRGGELDGARLIERDCMAMLMTPQTDPLPRPLLRTVNPRASADFDPFPETPLSHTLGFLRVDQDVPGMRHAGSVGWAGFANTHYWIDPASNIAAVFMTQMIPFADPQLIDAYQSFERAVYAE